MAEIVNLRLARKRKAHADKEAKAAENRISFGRPKGERSLRKAEKDLADRRLDAHRLDPDDSR